LPKDQDNPWVRNWLNVEGHPTDWRALLQLVGPDFLIQRSQPRFLSEEELIQWRINHWGTDLPPRDIHFKFIDNNKGMYWEFRTHLAPPSGVFKELGQRFPRLTFHLVYQLGDGTVGQMRYRNNKYERIDYDDELKGQCDCGDHQEEGLSSIKELYDEVDADVQILPDEVVRKMLGD